MPLPDALRCNVPANHIAAHVSGSTSVAANTDVALAVDTTILDSGWVNFLGTWKPPAVLLGWWDIRLEALFQADATGWRQLAIDFNAADIQVIVKVDAVNSASNGTIISGERAFASRTQATWSSSGPDTIRRPRPSR